jgi:hypothetical protein
MRSAISKVVATGFTVALSTVTIPPALAQDTCRQGFVWREAFAGDHVCVTPRTRDQAAQDNREADARRQPGGGAYGPNTCRSPYVWREARSGDTVCVTVETRSDTASDNAQAATRRVAAASPSSPTPTPAAATYKTSEWSSWTRAEGVEYRYRWGINTQDQRKPGNVDAMFQVRNRQNRVWQGSVRSLDCEKNQLFGSKPVTVPPNQTVDVKFVTPNCGSKDRPSFRPNVVKSSRID